MIETRGLEERSSEQDWYARQWDTVYRYIYRRVQNREEAQDLTQEVCARVLDAHGSSRPSEAYLYTTALNLIRDRWRRRSHGVLTPLEEAWLVAEDQDDRWLDRIWLRDLLERLPADQRAVLLLRLVEGHSRKETARRMGRSEAAIRGLQYRALQSLRELVHSSWKEADRP